MPIIASLCKTSYLATAPWYSDPNTVNAVNAISTAVIAFATLLYFCATIAYVRVTGRMWKVTCDAFEVSKTIAGLTKQNTELTRQMIEAASRPFVGAARVNHSISSTTSSTESADAIIELVLENHGGGPALDVRVEWRIEISGTQSQGVSLTDASWSVAILPKGTVGIIGRYPDGWNSLGAFYSESGGLAPTVIVLAKITYNSIAKQQYETKCEARYDGEKNQFFTMNNEAE